MGIPILYALRINIEASYSREEIDMIEIIQPVTKKTSK